MALINLSCMAEFFFHKTVTCDVEKVHSYGSRFLNNLSKEVLVLNNGFSNDTECFKIRVPPSTAYLKINEVFLLRLV